MRYTKEDVKREYKKAQERLKTFEKHTGFKYTIDKNLLKNTHRKEVVQYLQSIKWSSIGEEGNKVNVKMLKHVEIEVHPQGPASYGLTPYIVHDKVEAVKLITATKYRQQAERDYKRKNPKSEIKEFKPNPWTEADFKNTTQYALSYASTEKLEEWEELRNENARKNYVDNMTVIAKHAGTNSDRIMGYVLARLIDTVAIDIIALTANGANPWIWDLTAVNVFDSKQYDISAKSGKKLMDDFMAHGLLTKEIILHTIINLYEESGKKLGMDLYDIYEGLHIGLKISKDDIRRAFYNSSINREEIRAIKELFDKKEEKK